MNLNRLLNSIGKQVFVEYYDLFRDDRRSSEEIAAMLPPKYSPKSRQSRTSTARRIICEGFSRDALEIIASSEKLDPSTVAKARLLLSHL